MLKMDHSIHRPIGNLVKCNVLVVNNADFMRVGVLVFYNIGIELLHIYISISALHFGTPSRVQKDVLVVTDRI